MSATLRTRSVNPRLGTYFGIFASAFIALVLLTLIFERLGLADGLLRSVMLLGPLAMLTAIGIASRNNNALEYFASGRRVPAVFCGAGLAATALGGTGIVTIAGSLFIIGFDAIWLINAGLVGFVVMAVLLSSFLRKFGSYTLPSYLGRRFDSRVLRVTSGAVLAVPMLLMLVAELKIGIAAASWLSGQSETLMMMLIVSVITAGMLLGGTRSLTWTNVAAVTIIILALMTPVTIVAVLNGYLPVPQFSHGPVARHISRVESLEAIPIIYQSMMGFKLPEQGFQAIAQRFSSPFGHIGPAAYILAVLTIFTGISASPWLLPRLATTPGVYETRKSLGWATFFFGTIMLTVATIVVFARHGLVEIIGTKIENAPTWLSDVVNYGLAELTSQEGKISLTNVSFDRDSVLLSLPIMSELPMTFAYFAAIGIIATVYATAAAIVVALTNVVSEDIVNGFSWQAPAIHIRITTTRVLMAVVAAFAGVVAIYVPSDPLKLMLWVLILNGTSVFPVLVASIWWKRVNVYGAFASIMTGFSIAVIAIVSSEAGWLGWHGALAGLLALPASTIALVAVSLTTLRPTMHALELVRDIRVPGGEILYDREMRIMLRKERGRS